MSAIFVSACAFVEHKVNLDAMHLNPINPLLICMPYHGRLFINAKHLTLKFSHISRA